MGVLRIVAAVVLLLLFWATSALAAPVAQIDSSTRHMWLASHLDVLEDTTARLDLAEVTSPDVAARFKPFEGTVGPNYTYTSSALWVRFAVENASDVPIERWLVADVPFVEHIEVFRDGEPPAIQGVLHPRDERELPRRSYSFRIALAPHQTRVVHVRSWGTAERQVVRVGRGRQGAREFTDRPLDCVRPLPAEAPTNLAALSDVGRSAR